MFVIIERDQRRIRALIILRLGSVGKETPNPPGKARGKLTAQTKRCVIRENRRILQGMGGKEGAKKDLAHVA